jgi:hypothetical protein
MTKIELVIIGVLIFNTPIFAKIKPCQSEKKILQECNMDLDTKTTKGWIRLLQNKSKMETIGIELTKEEVHSLINCLIIKLQQDQLEPVGRIR